MNYQVKIVYKDTKVKDRECLCSRYAFNPLEADGFLMLEDDSTGSVCYIRLDRIVDVLIIDRRRKGNTWTDERIRR